MTTTPGTAVALRQETALSGEVLPPGYQPLALQPPGRLPTEPEYAMMLKIASLAVEGAGKALAKDRAIPANIKTPEQAMTIMLAGYELGMPPITALRRVFIVNGRTELETQALMGLVRAGDPTAQFVFHTYSREVVDVELFRGGKSIIRVDYTLDDARKSGQLKEKWYRKKDRNNNDAYVTLPKSARLEENEKWGAKVPNSRDPELFYVLELASSVWGGFTRDMLAYSAVKRCCRLGAPELTNQIGQFGNAGELAPPPYRVALEERAGGDEEGAPMNGMAKALVEGRLDPAAAAAADTAVDEEDRRQADPDSGKQKTPAPRRDPNAKCTPDLARAIIAALKDMRETWSPSDYGKFYRGLQAKYYPGKADSIDKLLPSTSLADAEAIRAEIAAARGEPPAPADVQTSVEPEDSGDDEPTYSPEDEDEPADDEESPEGGEA